MSANVALKNPLVNDIKISAEFSKAVELVVQSFSKIVKPETGGQLESVSL